MSSIQQVEQVAVEDGAWQQWRLTDEQAREAAARIVARDKASRQGIDTVVDIARFGSAV